VTILVIEDSRFLRTAIEKILAKAGYAVVATGDGQEGLKLALSVHPDLILLDMMLPSLEGTSVLSGLKHARETQSIPVVVLSSLPQSNEERLKAAGAAAYIQKSAIALSGDGESLVHIVRQLTGGTAARN